MAHASRRAFLGALTAAGTASVAGCSGLLGGDDGGGLPGYTDWIPASIEEDADFFAAFYVDLDRFQSEFSEEDQETIDLESIATRYDQDLEDLDSIVQLQTGLFSQHLIVSGSIDAQAALDSTDSSSEPEEYEQFDVVESQLAANSETVVESAAFEDVIDAYNGDAERLVDADGEWDAAFRNVGSGAYTVVQRASEDEAFEILGVQIDAGSDGGVDATFYAHFPDEDAAEGQRDAIESQIQEDAQAELDVQDVRRESNVIVVETSADTLNV